MGNPFLRPLFKPILNKASRAAYKMSGTAGEFSKATQMAGEKIYKSPYYKTFSEAARGKKGRPMQALAVGTPLYAYNKLNDLTGLPFRTTEPPDVEIEKEEIPKKDNELTTFPEKEKDETVNENTEVQEETLTDNDSVSDTETTDQGLLEQSNMYAGLIDNDSLKRIEGYKDVIRQIMGTGDEGQKMQNMAMLMQLGSALMSGKTMDRGLKGFFDVVGQAGMQTAPTLFQMGAEKGKADREIGAAALNMYMSEMDKMNDRSGPFTVVYENIYKTNENGEMVFDGAGNPITADKRRVQTFYRKSPEIQNFMDINSSLGYDRFTFVDTTASDKGMDIGGGFGGAGTVTLGGEAAQDAQIKYAKYLQRGLNTMSDYIMPLLISQKDTLTGVWGEVGRFAGPKKALFEALENGIVTSAGGREKFDNKFKDIQKDTLNDMSADNYIVYEAPSATQVIGGKEVGFFIDKENKYGFNANPKYADEGKTMVDPGEAAWIPTREGIEMLLDNPNRSAMITFETTLGLMLARDRQPTGRMLADVLRKSFQQTKMTGAGSDVATSPYQVINNYTYIYNTLYNNMKNALETASWTDDKEKADRLGWKWAPDAYEITGIDKFVSSYYDLRSQDERYIHDISGGPLYGYWYQSKGGGLTSDHRENKDSTKDIHENIMKELE